MSKKLVRMNVSIASSGYKKEDNWAYQPKQEVELDAELADIWIESGHATFISNVKEVVTEEEGDEDAEEDTGSTDPANTGGESKRGKKSSKG